jgi:transcriptional regulator with XRE-family HTH domain
MDGKMHTMGKAVLQAFGNRVRDIRTRLGWSQERLASECGLHRTYVGAIERGERNVSLLNIEKIATALDVSMAELLIEDKL